MLPLVATRMTGIQPSWATTKGEIFRTRPHNAIPSELEYPESSLKQNLWELYGTAYFEKDDHLIPFKSIDSARNDRETEKIVLSKRFLETTNTNASSFISANVNRT